MPEAEFSKMLGVLTTASRRVEGGEMTKTAFDAMAMSLGHHVNPDGVVASAALLQHMNWPHAVTYDWVHSMLQGGVFNREVECFLDASTTAGVTRDALQRYLQDPLWTFPHHHANACRRLHRVFDIRRVGDGESGMKVKGSCSELLSLYGLLRFFFELRVGSLNTLQRELTSFRAVCRVIDILLATKRGFLELDVAADQLAQATARHQRLFLDVYGPDGCLPKHHWMHDVVPQLRKDKLLLDAFIIERTHLSVKAIAEKVRNTTSFEKSVLGGLLTATANEWRQVAAGPGLRGRRVPMPGIPSVLLADAVEVFGIEIRVGDVVLRDCDVGEVAGCAEEEGDMFFFVSMYEKARTVTAQCDVHTTAGRLELWPAMQAAHAVAWQGLSDGTVLVLRK